MHSARAYVFLTPAALGRRRYHAVCAEFDLEPVPRGYGALLCHDEHGAEVMLLTLEPDYLRMVVATIFQLPALRAEHGMSAEPTRVDPQRFPLIRPGWPTLYCRSLS